MPDPRSRNGLYAAARPGCGSRPYWNCGISLAARDRGLGGSLRGRPGPTPFRSRGIPGSAWKGQRVERFCRRRAQILGAEPNLWVIQRAAPGPEFLQSQCRSVKGAIGQARGAVMFCRVLRFRSEWWRSFGEFTTNQLGTPRPFRNFDYNRGRYL